MTLRTTFTLPLALGLIVGAAYPVAQSQTVAPSAQAQATAPAAATSSTPAAQSAVPPTVRGKGKNAKTLKKAYSGPNTIVVLPATPMLDGEGKQRMDPDGNLMFNPAVKQIRDKKGHPVFDADNKPVFQTATNLGYDEKGKKIAVKKVKPPKMTPVSITAGTLTVDGWTGKARLNYDIADLKFLYFYAPGIGTTIVSHSSFPGAKEQVGAFNGRSLKITVDGHPIELASDKLLLGKKPQSAWVAVDRGFLLPAKFPVFGYGATIKAPYTWPGSKESVTKGSVQAPPLPPEITPTLLLAPCPAGMMRPGRMRCPGSKRRCNRALLLRRQPLRPPLLRNSPLRDRKATMNIHRGFPLVQGTGG
jgi:hypothetical protein